MAQTPSTYSYRRQIVIDHTKVANSDQSNFPVLISGTYSFLATVANGGKVQNVNGYDIIFSTDAAGSNKLDHEIESYDPATGTTNCWVRIPALSHSTDTAIYVQYGNGAITTSQANKTGVWDSNYQMVLHLDESGSPYKDSTSNGFSSTGGVYPAQAAGKIGQGQSFNGTSQYIAYSQAQSPNPTGSITLETWIKTTGTSSKAILGKWGNDGTADADQAYELYVDTSAMPGVALNSTNSSDVTFSGTTHINDGAWHHVAATAPSTGTVDVYVDGVLSSSLNNVNPLLATSVDRLLIGAGSIAYGSYYLNGVLDEVRISNSVRSPDWVATEYNNQNSSSTFYAVGSENASVVVLPGAVSLTKGQRQQFVATGIGASGEGVSWSISPAGIGSIDSTGLYTAPAAVDSTQSVTITVTSTTDHTRTGSGTVTLVPPYSFRRAIAIDHRKVHGSDQTNFPVLISGTYGYLATAANGGKVTSARGYDVIFSTDAVGSNKLDHEIESYDPVTGTANFWVRIPFLSHTADTTIFIQYGNSGITSSQENKTGVWDSNYQMVLHLDESRAPYKDSTSNGFSNTGGVYPAQSAGKIGQGQSFNGTSQYIAYSQAQSPSPTSNITLETWIKTTETSSKAILGKWGNDGTADADQAYELYVDSSAMPGVALNSTNSSDVTFSATTHLNDGAWHHLVATAPSSGTIDIYVDGVPRGFLNNTIPLLATSVDRLLIGAGSIAYGPYYLNGVLDEVRISNSVRSPDWVATEYNNQSSFSTFYAVGSENTTVVVLPATVSLGQGQTQQFTTTIVGGNPAVTWSVSPSGAGSVDGTGLYTAPSSIPSDTAVTIIATSSADGTKTGSAVVNLIGPYGFRRAVSINHTKVPNTDQSSFPILISGSYSFLATVANGGKVQSPNGYDIIFSSDAAGINKLDHEIESYDPVTGSINCWVRIPALSHTTDTLIYLQYGKRLITASQENRSGVWDIGYKDVLHFAGGTTLNVGDSTSNSNDGHNGGANGVVGKISGAAAFTGSQSIALPSLGVTSGETKFTLSAWVNATGSAGSILGQLTASGVISPSLSSNGSAFVAQAANPGIGNDSAIDTSATAPGQWSYVVGVFEADSVELFVNGASKARTPYRYASSALSNSASWLIGSLNGTIDEVRFSSVARAADRIATEYNNQSSPSTFYSLGAENAIRIYLTPSAPSLYGGQRQQFTPTLTNTTNMGVTWQRNPNGIGSIDGSGLYAAPPTVASQQTVTVTATSAADSAQTAQATITLYPPLLVSVSPSSPTFSVGQRQQFTATVSNVANTGVTWTLSPAGLGSITSAGLYTAPATIAAQQTVIVTATSVVDNNTSSSTSITLSPASTAYGYRRTITIDHNKVPNTLLTGQGQTNFPVLISGTYGYLATAANGGKVQSANGYDIIFTTDALGVNQLDYEMESYNPATGAINFWVRVPGLSFTADTVIYMQYGNPSVTASGENKTGVWDSNYQMVLHLGESVAPYQDSTRNAFSSVGGVAPTQSAGKVGRGQSFDGTSQYIAFSGNQSPNPEGAITMEAWVKTSDASITGRGIFGKWENDGASSADQSYELYIAGGTPHGLVAATDGSNYGNVGSTSAADGNWHHVVVAAEPFRTVSIYVDGVLSQSQAMNNQLLNPTVDRLLVGATNLAAGPYFMNGVLDEARISNSTRSADWVAAEYNNQSSPATFYAVGAEQTGIVLSPSTSSLYAGQKQQFVAAGVSWSLSPAGIGGIDASGLFTAPVPVSAQQTIVVTATSLLDSSKRASATVTLLPPIAITVSPATSTLSPSQTQQFTVVVANTPNAAVRWSTSPNAIGSLNSDGLYVAPAQIGTPQILTVTAISVADPTKQASSTVTLLPTANALFVQSLTPNRGEPGASITISGSHFGTNGSVTFNGRSATVSTWSPASIIAVVPNGAASGPLVVTSGGLSSNDAAFTVLSPIIGGLNPNHGSAGASVTVAGSNFGASAGTVTFGGQIATVSSWSDSSITVAAPNSNPGNVMVSNGGLQSNAVGFNAPTIVSLSPGSSLPGSSVTITGSGFGSNGTVTFAGGATAITTTWSDSSITATVPPGAVNGNVTVTVSGATSNGVAFLIQQPVVNGPILYSYDQVGRLVGMTAASGDAVQYSYDAVGNILAITRTAGNQPAILSFRPTSGPVGTQVTVSGSGFSATASQNAVSFNGVAAVVNSATTVQLVVTVPTGATTGALAITSPGGSATGSSLFTVTTAAIGTNITSFSPQLQNQGQAVTISGSGFDTQAGNNHVMVNTTLAAINGAPSATSLSILAPAGGSGRIRVITPAGVAVSTGDLFIVPSGSNISDVGYSGRANLGDTVTVTLHTSGFGLLLFDGKAGNSVSVSVGSSSFSACSLQLYQPNGSLMGSSGSCAAAGSLQAQVLPATGTYVLRVTPSGGATGSAQLTLIDASDVVNSIASGDVSTVTTSVPGQKGRLTFTGRAGQQVTVQLSANTFGSVTVSLVNSAGTVVSAITSSSAVFSLPKLTLAGTDQYTILVQPAAPGSIQVGLTLEGNGNTEPPLRTAGAVLDPSSPLAAGLKGLFLMSEGSGSSTQNLVDGQAAVFSGAVQPVWSGGALLLSGGASLNSYLDAGSDLNFDQITTGRMTIVAKVHLLTSTTGSIPGGGIAEKNDGDVDSGFVFGINSSGAIEAIVEKSSQDMEIVSPASSVVSAGWMQVAFTWDGTQGTAAAAHLFLNGVEQSKAEASDGAGYIGFANATNQSFRIGNAGFDIPSSLNGVISYLAVYKDRILTPAELGQLDTQLPIK